MKTKEILKIEKERLKKDIHTFQIGDTLRVQIKVREGERERLQSFSGTLIARKGSGINESIVLRRISYGEGVERTFMIHSPSIHKIEVEREGRSRRAKLYYLREKVGKKARVESRRRSSPAPESKG